MFRLPEQVGAKSKMATQAAVRLDADVPNVVVSFSIADDVILAAASRNETVELNIRKLFKTLTHRKREHERRPPLDMISSPQQDKGLADIGKGSSNRYNSVIDELERKYTVLANLSQVIDQEGNDSDDQESNSSNSNLKVASPQQPTDPVASKKRARKKVFGDEYDYSDGFLDDSEALQHYEEALRGKATKTKHDGFFVSFGNLEVEAAPRKPRMKKAKPGALALSAPDVEDPSKEQDKDTPKEKRKRKNKETAKDVEIVTQDAELDQPDKDRKDKPLWQPKPEVLAALDAFKRSIHSSGVVVTKKNELPLEAQDALAQYEAVVSAHHSARELGQTSGHLESIQEALGVEVSSMRVKAVLARVLLRRRAEEERAKLQRLTEELMQGLKAAIVPCPPHKQPGYKKGIVAAKAVPSREAGPAMEVDEGSLDDVPLSQIVAPQPDSTGVGVEAIWPADMPTEAAAAPTALASKASKDVQFFRYYCHWTIPLRQMVFGVEPTVCAWVEAENRHREKLTQSDKADLPESECVVLVTEEEVEKTYQRIASVFPDSCLQGSALAVKNAMKIEKARVYNARRREEKLKEGPKDDKRPSKVDAPATEGL